MCALFCRSLACAAMLMYDYPLKTDMETVRHMCVCLNVALGACVCLCAAIMPEHVQ